ncbi:MAG: DUF421 domain-containing protein [Ruminococcaceae bacterium]|nr:DUF421 domain-containing protein [Oscillospiraceae bacterium]
MASSFFRGGFLYLVLILTVRLMGKRQVGQMEPSEFVVTMLMADLVSIPMDDPSVPLSRGLLPMAAVLGTELLLSVLSMDFIKLRRLLCGKPVILIENGRLIQRNLRRTRITADELRGHLRIKEVMDINTVQYAILETNGELSVFLWPRFQSATVEQSGLKPDAQSLPVTLVEDGQLLRQNLLRSGKDEMWVRRQLQRRNSSLRQTYLMTVDGTGKIFWLPKEK